MRSGSGGRHKRLSRKKKVATLGGLAHVKAPMCRGPRAERLGPCQVTTPEPNSIGALFVVPGVSK